MGGPQILVALDTSELAARGADYAAGLADALDAELVLYTAVDGPVRNGLAEFAAAERMTLDKAVGVYLGRMARDLEAQGNAVSYHHEDSSDAAESIVGFTDANDIGMIVMTTHGRTGLARQLMGSVTERVLHSTSVPIYVVPPDRTSS